MWTVRCSAQSVCWSASAITRCCFCRGRSMAACVAKLRRVSCFFVKKMPKLSRECKEDQRVLAWSWHGEIETTACQQEPHAKIDACGLFLFEPCFEKWGYACCPIPKRLKTNFPPFLGVWTALEADAQSEGLGRAAERGTGSSWELGDPRAESPQRKARVSQETWAVLDSLPRQLISLL